jgi:hypothetical protein
MRNAPAIGVCLLLAIASAAPASAQLSKSAVSKPCKAAVSPVRYGKILRINRKLRAEIAAYRRSWAAACAKGGGASLGGLLTRAERIKAGMMKAIAARRPQGKTADRLHEQLSKVYPTFVPAMEGSIIEFEFFEPMLAVFKAHARLGNAEDRAFFESHDRLFGGDFKAPPWIERTWDYGGCIRLGRWSPHGAPRPGYDFVAAASDIARLKTILRTRWYREKVTTLEARMLRTLATLPQKRGKDKTPLIDACGTKAEAIAEMKRIAARLRGKHSAYRRAGASLRRTLKAIAEGRVRVCEKASCPGG